MDEPLNLSTYITILGLVSGIIIAILGWGITILLALRRERREDQEKEEAKVQKEKSDREEELKAIENRINAVHSELQALVKATDDERAKNIEKEVGALKTDFVRVIDTVDASIKSLETRFNEFVLTFVKK